LVEKPAPEDAPSTLSIIGRYILHSDVFKQLENHRTGSGGEIQLTDAISAMLPTTPFTGYRFEGKRFDCGSRTGFVEANIAFALDRPDMREGIQRLIQQYAQAE
jgi:UTP--glucose-1-phosphate uridylyltransferase